MDYNLTMAKIQPVSLETANDAQAELLKAVEKRLGKVPNILATMANAPAALKSYLGLSEAMAQSSLSYPLRECLSLAISEKNNCDYCLAAHTVIGKMSGLSEEETRLARQAKANEPEHEAALKFALRVMETNGFISEDDRAAAKSAGLGDQQQIEIVAMIALNTLTNLFNHIADTDIDFPPAPEL